MGCESLWLWSLKGGRLWVRVLWESGSANLGPRRGKDGFHGSTGLAQRSRIFTGIPLPGDLEPLGAEPQNYRESNHGETGKGDPFWGLKSRLCVWANHGGFGSHFTGVRSRITALPNSRQFRGWGAQKPRPLLDRHTHPPWGRGLENPKD